MAWKDVNTNLPHWYRSTPKAFMLKRHKYLGVQTLNSCCKKCKNKIIIVSGNAWAKDIILKKSKDKIERFDFFCTLETIDDLMEEKVLLICKGCSAKKSLIFLIFILLAVKLKFEKF